MSEDGDSPNPPTTIQQRIAALRASQAQDIPIPGQAPQSRAVATKPQPLRETVSNGPPRPRPPPPPIPVRPAVLPRPNANARTVSSNNPPTRDHVAVTNGGIGNQPDSNRPSGAQAQSVVRPTLPPRTSTQSLQSPALPPRRPSEQSPALPPRRPSENPSLASRRPSEMALSRRGSNESVSSVNTARSSVSGLSNGSKSDRFAIRAPEFDLSSLPPLPPKRTIEEKEAAAAKADAARRPYKKTYSSPNVQPQSTNIPPQPPSRPQPRQVPILPGRQPTHEFETLPIPAPAPATAPRRTEPPPPKRSALSLGFGVPEKHPILPPNRPGSVPAANGAPPIPTASRPNLEALKASKPNLNGTTTMESRGAGSCLLCRDFSGPDNHATRFPRESLPSMDIGWLAHQLTSPFPSATDKARAIFTWLHHNVAYDTVAFFNNNVRGSTPQSTLATGLAVCEGYAALFAALAMKVGLEAIVVGGNGKGYGYNALRPGDPIPPFNAGHAWNAVRIDGGEWKLTDPCWGAGAVNGKDQPYAKRFAPERFTQSNDEFGLSHFPEDSSKQFRNDGRVISWAEYMTSNKSGTGAQTFNGYMEEEGISATSMKPTANPIVLAQQGPTVRFSFQKVCPHWDPVRCGKGPWLLYILVLDGLDGTDRNHIPMQQGNGVWWCDVPVRDLGRPGQNASVMTVTTFDGRDARGLTTEEYVRGKGRVGMSFGGVAMWTVA